MSAEAPKKEAVKVEVNAKDKVEEKNDLVRLQYFIGESSYRQLCLIFF